MNMVTKKRKPYWNRFRDTSTFSRLQQAKNSWLGDRAYRWCLSTSTCTTRHRHHGMCMLTSRDAAHTAKPRAFRRQVRYKHKPRGS